LGPNCKSNWRWPSLESTSTKGHDGKPQTWQSKRKSPRMFGPLKGFVFQIGHMKVKGSWLMQCVSIFCAVHRPFAGKEASQSVTGKREQRDLQL